MKEELELFLKENLIVERKPLFFKARKMEQARSAAASQSVAFGSVCEDTCAELPLDAYLNDNKKNPSFRDVLFKYIDNKNLKDSDVYNKVNIDRRLFSKIRCDDNYNPSKETIILLGISLELSLKEFEDLLITTSYHLSNTSVSDLIIKFCFINRIYNIDTINDFLYDHKCKTLN